jgi:hypothetical protein
VAESNSPGERVVCPHVPGRRTQIRSTEQIRSTAERRRP